MLGVSLGHGPQEHRQSRGKHMCGFISTDSKLSDAIKSLRASRVVV